MRTDVVQAQKPSSARWFPILALIFVATLINYLSRAVFGIARPLFAQELHIAPVWAGIITSAFGYSYVAAQIPAGVFLDRFGTRFTYFLSVVSWSCFNLALGFASGAATIFGSYLGLGLCESPCFPANSRVLAHWFPQHERARANSVYAIGQTAGTGFLIVPLLWLVNNYGWRALFIMVGLAGVVFGFIWYVCYREPQDSKFANQAELDYIVAGGGLKANPNARVEIRWKYIVQLLRFRQILCASIGQFCGSTVLVFFLLDFATYLVNQRHMAYLKSPLFVALPYIAAAAGGVVGGLIADTILKNGGSINLARKLPVVGGLLLASCIALADFIPMGQDALIVAIMCVAFFGQGASNLGWTVISDLAPRQVIGLTGGLFNTITNLATILTPIIIGVILQFTGSYFYSLLYVGAMPLLGAFLYVFVMGDIKRLEIME